MADKKDDLIKVLVEINLSGLCEVRLTKEEVKEIDEKLSKNGTLNLADTNIDLMEDVLNQLDGEITDIEYEEDDDYEDTDTKEEVTP